MTTNNFVLTIGWLYPDLMSTYGDRGNIIILKKRCEWREIDVSIMPINKETKIDDIKNVNLIFGGGAQDMQQEIVMEDLKGEKGKIIKHLIEKGIPALFVCGSPQLMGLYYEPSAGERIEGLGVFDMVTKHPGLHVPRCIGNVIAKTTVSDFAGYTIVGFENHGGRTTLGKTAKPFAKVIKGFGNNGKDGTEGVVYKNAIGCYFHGPILSKNPELADYIIKKSIEIKYKKKIELKKIDNTLETLAKEVIVKRYSH